MHLFGKANWWLPKWLDKILPHLSVEPADDDIEYRERELIDATRR